MREKVIPLNSWPYEEAQAGQSGFAPQKPSCRTISKEGRRSKRKEARGRDET